MLACTNPLAASFATAAAPAVCRPRDMAIVFTCGKCDTRSMKAFTRQAYEHGLVLITCPGCQAMHLIADHLGWFGDTGFKVSYLVDQHHVVAALPAKLGKQTSASSVCWRQHAVLTTQYGGHKLKMTTAVTSFQSGCIVHWCIKEP